MLVFFSRQFQISNFLWVLFLSSLGFSAITLENMKEARTVLGLDRYPTTASLTNLKIAVIDNGFAGMEGENTFLPASTKLVNTYPADFIKKFNLGDPDFQVQPQQTEHGRIMAQIIWAITGANAAGPQFYLLNGGGITGFKRAVRYAIEEKVDIILYSQNRECCGNYDGKGFFNQIVNQALDAGILWVNAAGNYGGNVFNSAISRVESDQTVTFAAAPSIRLKSYWDNNGADLILTWSANPLEEDTGTDKDLDLYVYDESGTEIKKSTLTQVLKKPELGEGETFLAREKLTLDLSKNSESGYYRVVVKAKGRNFNNSDQVRLVLIPRKAPIFDPVTKKMKGAIELVDATRGKEIMVPADNPGVITVGDLSSASALGPTMDGRMKPEIILENSTATFSDGNSSSGTSNAAAYFAGILAVLKAYRPQLQRADVISFPKRDLSALAGRIQNVSIQEFAVLHSRLLFLLEDVAGESPVLAGRYQDGRYVLGMRNSPKTVLGNLCGPTGNGETEYYLTLSNGQLQCFTRKLAESVSRAEAYPWEYAAVRDRFRYIEIRQARRSVGVELPNGGIWMTPTPEQLLNHF